MKAIAGNQKCLPFLKNASFGKVVVSCQVTVRSFQRMQSDPQQLLAAQLNFLPNCTCSSHEYYLANKDLENQM